MGQALWKYWTVRVSGLCSSSKWHACISCNPEYRYQRWAGLFDCSCTKNIWFSWTYPCLHMLHIPQKHLLFWRLGIFCHSYVLWLGFWFVYCTILFHDLFSYIITITIFYYFSMIVFIIYLFYDPKWIKQVLYFLFYFSI